MWEIIGFIAMALMLWLLPGEAYTSSKRLAWVVILVYSAIYLYVIRLSGAGRFMPLDAVWIGLMYGYMIVRPLSLPLVKIKDLAEFEVVYRLLYLILFIYVLIIRKIDLDFSLQVSGKDWLITLGLALAFIIPGTILSGGIHQISIAWKQIRLKELLITGIYMFYLVAISQEIFFRGIIQNLLAQWFGPFVALIAGTIIFGLAHLNYAGFKMVLMATIAGLVYGLVYLWTGNVFCSVICHTLTNVYWKQVLRRV